MDSFDYTLRFRTLPIAVTLVSLGSCVFMGRCALNYLVVGGHNPCSVFDAWAEEGDRRQLVPNSGDDFDDIAEEGSLVGTAAGVVASSHDMQVGRPDLAALIRSAAAAVVTTSRRRGTAPPRLVVAACGPAELVEASQRAVAAVHSEEDCGVPDVCFSGTNSRW